VAEREATYKKIMRLGNLQDEQMKLKYFLKKLDMRGHSPNDARQ
jgi:hypothetical protein